MSRSEAKPGGRFPTCVLSFLEMITMAPSLGCSIRSLMPDGAGFWFPLVSHHGPSTSEPIPLSHLLVIFDDTGSESFGTRPSHTLLLFFFPALRECHTKRKHKSQKKYPEKKERKQSQNKSAPILKVTCFASVRGNQADQLGGFLWFRVFPVTRGDRVASLLEQTSKYWAP